MAYTFYEPPTITSLFPAGGPSDGGTALRLGGAGSPSPNPVQP